MVSVMLRTVVTLTNTELYGIVQGRRTWDIQINPEITTHSLSPEKKNLLHQLCAGQTYRFSCLTLNCLKWLSI